MEKTFASARLAGDAQSRHLIDYITFIEAEIGIVDGTLYYDFPLYRDSSDQLHQADVLLASRSHGVVLFSTISAEPGRLQHPFNARTRISLNCKALSSGNACKASPFASHIAI